MNALAFWRSTVCVSLLATLAACGGGANDASLASAETARESPAAAAPRSAVPAEALRWSAPATWGGKLPADGDRIRIPAGTTILLDTTTADLGALVIEGSLLAAEGTNVAIRSRYVLVTGSSARLAAGSAKAPFTGRLRIDLTAAASQDSINGMGTKFLAAESGATLDLFGTPKLPWARLNGHAAAGSRQLKLERDPTGWAVGDQVAIAPTDYLPLEAEQRTITSISGRVLTLDAPLAYTHWGTLQTISGMVIDQRAEVANLSRNIAVNGATNSATEFGGHTMITTGAQAHLSNVEFSRMGQLGFKGRYPLHFHLLGDLGRNSFATGLSIHHTFQRGLVLHQSNNVRVSDNIVYDTVGMQYFLEDGVEVGNVFERNLGLLARQVPTARSLSNETLDRGDGNPGPERPAAFWITNRHNVFRNNVAVGVVGGWGFAFRGSDVLPVNRAAMPLPPNADQLMQLPQLEFSNNYARTISKGDDHFNLGYGPEEAGSCYRFGGGGDGGAALSLVGPQAFKCVNAAFWSTNGMPILKSVVADARTAVTQDQGVGASPVLVDARVVAFSGNDPRHVGDPAANDPLDRGPFGTALFEATEAGATQLVNALVAGRFDNAALNPAFTVPAATSVTGDFKLQYDPAALIGLESDTTQALTVHVQRLGWAGPIDVRLPDYGLSDKTSGLSAEPLVIPAGADSGVLVLHATNHQRPADVAEGSTSKTFGLFLLSSGGGRVRLDSAGIVELASTYLVSRPGVNIGRGYTTDSPRGLSAMVFNLGINFAFDGTDEFAWAGVPDGATPAATPWAEIDFDHRQRVSQIRLWQPPVKDVYGEVAPWGNFVVLVSDFMLIPDAMTIDQALALPFVRAFTVAGQAGLKGAPTVIGLPAGTTARSIRVWKRTTEPLTLQEMQVIGG